MKRLFCLFLVTGIVFSSCTETFKKGDKGLEYKIFSSGGKEIKYGNFIQLNFQRFYNNGTKDSLLASSYEKFPIVQMLDSVSTPPEYFKIFIKAHKGDSIVIRQLVEDAFKGAPQGIPELFKKGNYINVHIKMMDVFENGDQARRADSIARTSAYKRDSARAEAQVAVDDKKLNDYFAKNNIKTVKAPGGTYVEIINPGTGNMLDSSEYVFVNYTGKTLDGVRFDSNTDSLAQNHEPYPVSMNPKEAQVIKGWSDGFTLLKKGSVARFYIPSNLGYGPIGNGEKIKPFEILVFDIEIADVKSKAVLMAEQVKKQNEMMAKQKHYSDSMLAAQKRDSAMKKAAGK